MSLMPVNKMSFDFLVDVIHCNDYAWIGLVISLVGDVEYFSKFHLDCNVNTVKRGKRCFDHPMIFMIKSNVNVTLNKIKYQCYVK